METLNRGKTTGNRDSLYQSYTEENKLRHSLYRMYQPHKVLGVCCRTTMASLTHNSSRYILYNLTHASFCPSLIYIHTQYELFTEITIVIVDLVNQSTPVSIVQLDRLADSYVDTYLSTDCRLSLFSHRRDIFLRVIWMSTFTYSRIQCKCVSRCSTSNCNYL